jgi:hypothetical protein
MMGRILGPFGIEEGTTASPRPLVASWTTMGRALASNTIRGVKPASAQAASSAARTPVPRGRVTSGTSRSLLIVSGPAPRAPGSPPG